MNAQARHENELLRDQRLQRGWSQARVAEQIGTIAALVSKWERGISLPTPYYREKLCVLYGLPAQKLGLLPRAAGKPEDAGPTEQTGTIVEQLRPEQERTEAESTPLCPALSLAPCPHVWNVPHQRNPFFTGREDVLRRLYELLHETNSVVAVTQHALCGLGGIGKTQTALEYAYRYGEQYQAVLWVKADSRENLVSDVLSLATLLHLPERDGHDQAVTMAAIKRWLHEHTGWLLICDNADDLTLVQEFLPTDYRGHILLTTRAQAMGGLAQRIEMEQMSQEVGALFLLRRSGIIGPDDTLEDASERDRIVAKEMVWELGGLPLALDQAGAYIEESASSLQEYVLLYRQHRYELLKRRGGLTTDHPEPVATTWSLAFARVEQMDTVAADIVRLCAFLDPDAIPEEIVTEGVPIPNSSLDAVPLDQLRVNQAIEVLLRFSLIQRNSETRTLTIHRLVQFVLKDQMGEVTQHQWVERAVRAVDRAISRTINAYSVSGQPHRAVQLLEASIHIHRERGDQENLATALRTLAVQQQVIGKLLTSEQNLQESVALCSDMHNTFNEAKAYQSFALLRAYQGSFEEASWHLDTALALFKTVGELAAEGGVWAYRGLCALLTGDIPSALMAVSRARELADVRQDERDIIRAEWLLGWTCICLASQEEERSTELLQEAEQHLREALHRCRQINMVDYEADLLLAWARLHHARGDKRRAKASATEALAITNRSGFRVLRADVYNLLARLALEGGNPTEAVNRAQAALHDASCDGPPYCYKPALEEAKRLLDEISHYH
jgi:tetratricopeptide (TPR) repeat protein/transcriptional regulator with XRE-family HTH domain